MIRAVAALLGTSLTLAAADTINVFMYSEYMHPDIPADFTKATGHTVKIVTYETQEDMLVKMQSGGSRQYDVVIASDVVIPKMIGLALVQPLTAASLPNAKHMAPHLLNQKYDAKNQYSYPYFWGTVGLFYDSEKARGEPTWNWVFTPSAMPGHSLMMDEMLSTMGCANLAMGFEVNTRKPEHLSAVAKALRTAKSATSSLGFIGGVDARNKVAKGEAVVAMVYNGDAVSAIKENPKLAFAIPREGSIIAVDCMLVTKNAPHPDTAHAFINYLMDPAVAAKNANQMHYATPNAAALPSISEEDRKNPVIYPDAETLKRLHYLEDAPKSSELIKAAWGKIKS